jgi:hypothetical protein
MHFIYLFLKRDDQFMKKGVHQSIPPARGGGTIREGTSHHLGESKPSKQNTLLLHQFKLKCGCISYHWILQNKKSDMAPILKFFLHNKQLK